MYTSNDDARSKRRQLQDGNQIIIGNEVCIVVFNAILLALFKFDLIILYMGEGDSLLRIQLSSVFS